jgi:hypothetical protein
MNGPPWRWNSMGQVLGKASTFAAAMMMAWIAAPAAAGTMQVVSAGDEYEKFHPRPHAAAPRGDFHATMDQVFGAGRWRQTSGYRTRAQEDALRRQGAGTVAAGHTSLHSIGGPDAPAAYDAVVDHMALAKAAAKLKQAGGGFARVLAERAHGPQGAHLHVELISAPGKAQPTEASADDADASPPPVPKRRRGAGRQMSPRSPVS